MIEVINSFFEQVQAAHQFGAPAATYNLPTCYDVVIASCAGKTNLPPQQTITTEHITVVNTLDGGSCAHKKTP